ncbi:MAG: ABC transporter permease [Acidobacteriaceae bacterium]|nr:ABC transporter permease [Acidobacteriaceae bacterium]
MFRSERLGEELDRELEFHLAETIDRFVDEGMPAEEARRRASLRFGNYSIQKERTRDMNITGWLDALRGDLIYGLRQLKLNPGFAAIAILSLALGIGANTAIFQLLDAIRLRGLPVQDPSRLATVVRSGDFFTAGSYFSREEAFTYAQMQSLKQHATAFADMLIFWPTRFNLSTAGESRYAEGLLVSSNFLTVLGVNPIAGNGIPAFDDRVACSSAPVVLSYAFWQRQFGGELNAIGKAITLDGHRFTIGGITPPSFFGVEPGQRFDVALPLCSANVFAKDGKGRAFDRMAWWLTPIARLKPGWTLERASAQVRDLAPAIFRETVPAEYRPDFVKQYLKNKVKLVSASAGVSSLRRAFESPLWILMAITGSVLLIACANLANLLLARASAREREMAVRQAVGAWRGRLILQLLSESLLLAVGGAVLGFGIAFALSRTLVAFLSSPGNPVSVLLGVDWHVFGFLSALALGTCILFGLIPAIRASGGAPATAMRGSRTTTATRERNGLRRMLVMSQVALSLILLVAALLSTISFRNLLATNVGFNSHNILIADVTARGPGFENPERRKELFRELQERFVSLHGVSSSAPVAFTPLGGFGWNNHVHADNDPARSGGKQLWLNRAGPGYFATMETPILAGRDFTIHDDLSAPKVALINQTCAKTLFGRQNPLGRTFRVEGDANTPDTVFEIVGVIADTHYSDLSEEQRSIAFFPLSQEEQPGDDRNFVIRVHGPLDQVQAEVQHEVSLLNANLLIDFRLLDVQIHDSVLRERLMANLSAAFALLAACLSTLGLYGVTSYIVARRRNEIGVRVALGATRARVYGLVAKDVSIMLATGLLVGVMVSLLLSHYAKSVFYHLKSDDPLILTLATGLLVATGSIAALFPARRAANLDALSALREE